MTIAIGSTPIETPANRPTRSGGAGHDGQADDAPSFDDLVEGSGSRHAKPLAGGPGRKDNAARLGGGNADSPSLSPPADGSLDEVLASDQEHGPQKTRADRRERHGDETREHWSDSEHTTTLPLRDRAPLFATLNQLGQRGDEVSSAGIAASLSAQAAESPDATVASSGRQARKPGLDGSLLRFATQDTGDALDGKLRDDMGRPAIKSSGTNEERLLAGNTDKGSEMPEKARAPRSLTAEKETRNSDAARYGPDRPLAKPATVTQDRAFPAPAAHTMSPATARVIQALSAGNNLASVIPASTIQPPATIAPAHMLKIELHPAELGMVVANLRLSGEQLSVELRPETAEAYRRLVADSEVIAGSLKRLGFDIDSITILQPSIASTPAARSDPTHLGPSSSMVGRDASQFQSGTPGGQGGGFSGQQSGRNGGNEQAFDRPAPAHRERAGGGLFI